ncbi:MAG: acetate kinase [Leptolyngbyaceae cyanobacterium SL_7_1]|nr:acetate kinase [Leptolyngbyaceae cyanobacterium SL_7_1]
MKILVLNAGSSSQKSCLYELTELPDRPPQPLWEAHTDWSHQQGVAELQVKTIHGAEVKTDITSDSRRDVTEQMLKTLWSGATQVIQQPNQISIVGHRVVHGGETYQSSTRVTEAVKGAIADLIDLAPAHNPANLEGIQVIEELLGADVPQVAVFDTAFHSQMPRSAATYAVPYEWFERGIRRYGFHGISHQYCAQRAAQLLDQELSQLRLINCHLGNGCSLAAIRDGYSVDTTMGFTPLEGLMMGTRSGSVDPGILLYLLREGGYTADQLDEALNKASGLKGVSGVSGDMRQIMQAIDQGNDRAQLALDIFFHRLRSCVGSMLASLGGLDALIFTAGIGENSPEARLATVEAFEFLGWEINPEKNAERSKDDRDIATPESTVRVLVIHTQEDWAIAQECWRLAQSH